LAEKEPGMKVNTINIYSVIAKAFPFFILP
jgi:hypothetical protein